MIHKFNEVETNNGILIVNGDLVEGTEVFIEQDAEVVPAPDGEYETEDKIITIEGGLIKTVEDKQNEDNKEETPAENTEEVKEEETPAENNEETKEEEVVEDEKDKKIKELEAKIAELEAKIADLEAELGKANEQLSVPVKTETKMEKQNKVFKTNYLH